MQTVQHLEQKESFNVCNEIYAGLCQWFQSYVRNMESPNLLCKSQFDFKLEHTLRVVDEIINLGSELCLSMRDLLVAKTIALLHDVGRFEQYRKYGTFNDYASMDHGAFGANIIQENGLLKKFSNQEKNCIYNAVLWHNKHSLPEEQKDERWFFAKLIRDADKLDILQMNLNRMLDTSSDDGARHIQLSEDVSDHIYQGLMQEKSIHYGKLVNKTDFVLSRIGWIFDLNFAPTFFMYVQRNFFETFSSTLPNTPKVTQVLTKIKGFLDQKCV